MGFNCEGPITADALYTKENKMIAIAIALAVSWFAVSGIVLIAASDYPKSPYFKIKG